MGTLLRLLVLSALAVGLRVDAAPVVVPPGLNAGDAYRLIFVTSTMRDARSDNPDDYGAFVTAAANAQPELAVLGTTWRAVASVFRVGFGLLDTVPTYNLAGQLVSAPGQFFSQTHAAPVAYLETGARCTAPSVTCAVWTGAVLGAQSGTVLFGSGASSLGAGGSVALGDANAADALWAVVLDEPSYLDQHLYAISGPLVVPATVPEPAPSQLLLGGLALVMAAQRYRRRRRRYRTTRTAGAPLGGEQA